MFENSLAFGFILFPIFQFYVHFDGEVVP